MDRSLQQYSLFLLDSHVLAAAEGVFHFRSWMSKYLTSSPSLTHSLFATFLAFEQSADMDEAGLSVTFEP